MAEKGVQLGTRAPDFELPDSEDSVFRLNDELKRGPIMLLFYPNDFGIVCSLEMRTFQGMCDDFKAKGLRMVGISRNSILTHKQWKESMDIRIRLLSDENGSVCLHYAGLQDSSLLKGMPRRAVFVLSQDGLVRYLWISHSEGLPPPFDEVRAKVLSLDLA